MTKLSLGSRLFISHLLVMAVGLSTFVTIAKISSPRAFVLHLQKLERRGLFRVRSAKTYLIDGFNIAWNRGATWSFIVGATAAGGLSYWASQRIVQPLDQIKAVTQKFAAGDFQERVSESEIPELDQLGLSFNRMANSIEDVEQRRRDLVSDMTHELRTPLTVVRGYLEEMADGSVAATPELCLQLVNETRRLERLTRDLQELSKAEAGYLSIDPQPVNLQPLLKTMVEKFADQLLDDGPRLTLDYPADLPLVNADHDRTEQILVNLLGNAVHYTEFGSIHLKAWSEANQVWIAVIDTGPGIAPEDLPHVFERFWRADHSRTRQSGGTGIGLAIARRLVELQGGQIEVESQLEQGSIFRFSLPITSASEGRTKKA